MDVDKLRLSQSAMETSKAKGLLPRHRGGQRFLRGPVPMDWIHQAGRLPGKALSVGMELWHLAGMQKRNEITLSLSRMEAVGIDRETARRGLSALERAGLVQVVRRAGRKPVVTILEVPSKAADAADEKNNGVHHE